MSVVLINPFGLGGGGGGGAWTPASLPNLRYWYESDSGRFSDAAGTTAQNTNGGDVQCWKHMLNNGDDAVRNASGVPSYNTSVTLNGIASLEFDASNSEYLNLPNIISGDTAEGEMFVVMKVKNSPAASGAATGLMNMATGGDAPNYPWTDGAIYDNWGRTGYRQLFTYPSLTVPHVYNPSHEAPSSQWVLRIGSTLVDASGALASVTFPTTPWLGRSTPGTYYLDGYVWLVVHCGHVCTTTERAAMSAYINAKYGI